MAKRPYRAPVERALYTAQLAVVYYSGLMLFHRRMLYEDSPMEVSHFEALSTIPHIAHEAFAHNKRNMSPFSWGLEMAAIETNDPIYRGWIGDRLLEARNYYRHSVIASENSDQMIRSDSGYKAFHSEYMHR
ncbi:hypothetical protein N7520_009502 [Penicillium odoratum]|uniref:uncharacterized protein n=1 Tax=Penicillium odoratum TaxID=1167516 RepID=UPI0025495617|nr:uncharacterized protein N7520_009502 [Penicillium odoratum]KAJ5752585.1 hypothetical protein N7520_009502 [Penicillium odoratum]